MITADKTAYRPYFEVSPFDAINVLKEHMLIDGFDLVFDPYESTPEYFADARTGKKYLDFFTCFASMPFGMNHPKLTEKSFMDYLGRHSVNKPSNSDIYSEAMAVFVKTMFNIAMPDYFKYSFFIEGGALAVENAIKTAIDWKVRKNFRKGYTNETGTQILHFEKAFHGRSGYTMSLTNTDPNKTALYPKFDWPRVPAAPLHFPLTQDSVEITIGLEQVSIEKIKQEFYSHKDQIAAIIIEPVQAEGGDRHFRSEYLQTIRNLADENEALLIFDEVQTGMGMTGKWWAHEHFGVIPDIMTFGKKMQVCGFVSTDRIDDIEDNVFHHSSRINSTWGGGYTDMIRATRILEIIHEDRLIQNSAVNGNYLLDKIELLTQNYSELIDNPRGLGLMCSFDFRQPEKRGDFLKQIFDSGLIILGCGSETIRFRPPLNISKEHIDKGFDIIEKVMGRL